ncbi:hypothetical protein [Rhodococcus zopfii]|uniref:hypothetical protein n=1 Tax=Rhodococcus zopfii TaxID=43772 RepID=UPI00352844D5
MTVKAARQRGPGRGGLDGDSPNPNVGGCRSINDFLIGTLPISAADAARRVNGARKVGVARRLAWLHPTRLRRTGHLDRGASHHRMEGRRPHRHQHEDPACDACHALVHEGPGGRQTRVAPTEWEYPGRTDWIPPPHIDPERTPRVNHRHHLGDLLSAALAHYRARRDTELREHRRRWLREPAGDAAGGEVP